ncbi:MAG TPA: septal ring lytic transglycosylase RlpA family protein [Gammaproteobacteria bacterium]|nr:septal ring lytic transglycosylase RlpA family protein [Gammaproteobacteria bacterium]
MKTKRYLVKSLGWVLTSLFMLQLSACSTVNGQNAAPPGSFNANAVPDAVPRAEALSHYGNPTSYKVGGRRYYVMRSAEGYDKTGYASWYGTKFHGQRTSSREPYNMFSMTAASPILPIPTYVRVTNLANGRSAIVKVNDRGPFHSNRIIDLSYAAAAKLGYANRGTALVRVTSITMPDMMGKNYASNNVSPQQATFDSINNRKTKATATNINNRMLAQNQKSMYLQVGAYKDRGKAVTVSKRIAALTQREVSIRQSYRNHERVYRVHIGPLADAGESSKVSQLLQKNGYEKPMTVSG